MQHNHTHLTKDTVNNARTPFEIHGTTTGRIPAALAHVGEVAPRTDRHGHANWRDCPQCNQSVTGKYLGRFGCRRCGYTEAA